MYQPQHWPMFHIINILKPHKTHDQRTTLMYFLTFNGMEPHAAAEMIQWRDADPITQEPVKEVYDRKAIYDMQVTLANKATNGTLWANMRVYSCENRRLMTSEEKE